MKAIILPSLLLLPNWAVALDLGRPSCLLNDDSLFELTLLECTAASFRTAVQTIIADKKAQLGRSHCLTYADEMKLLAQDADLDVTSFVSDACDAAKDALAETPKSLRDIFEEGAGFDVQDDIEFFNGGTHFNTEYDGAPDTTSLSTTADFVNVDYDYAMGGPLSLPSDYIEAFDNCNANAVTCCYVADRQSDGHGTCADGDDCSNADPIDNTDVCYVDNTNSNFASHTKGGFSIFPGDDEGPVYCEGFAWSRASLKEASYRYRGNVLYEVALKQNLVNRGYVRGVPGAPMCGCVGKMPVITDAACTEVVAEEEFGFSMSTGGSLDVIGTLKSMSFESCSAGTLSAQMSELHDDGRVTSSTKNRFDASVTGGSCDSAITTFLSSVGFVG